MNRTKDKVKLTKTGANEITLVFPAGTAARLRTYVPVADALAILRCPTAEVEGQELDPLEEIEVGSIRVRERVAENGCSESDDGSLSTSRLAGTLALQVAGSRRSRSTQWRASVPASRAGHMAKTPEVRRIGG